MAYIDNAYITYFLIYRLKFVYFFFVFHFSTKHSSLFKIFVIKKNSQLCACNSLFLYKLFFNICFNSCFSEYLRSILKMNIGILRSVSLLFKIHAFHEYFLTIFLFFYILIMIYDGKNGCPSKYDTRRYVRVFA